MKKNNFDKKFNSEVGFTKISKEDAAKLIAKRDNISYQEALDKLNNQNENDNNTTKSKR